MVKQVIKNFLSQSFINNFYHLPEAVLANIIYGFPTRGMKVIGVTGTDGKTTTVNMIYEILKAAGKKVSMVSTINAVVAGKSYDTGFHVTSPGRFAVQNFAKQAKENGDEYLVLEVTSHALDQYRFWGIKFDVGVITNITHEHLDYHKTFENYFNTKLKLVKDVASVVLNESIKGVESIKGKIITFGFNKGDLSQKNVKLKLKIPGNYNVENALASLAVAFVLEIDKKTAQKALENFSGLRGRMEEVENKKEIKIIIDFAHTPNGIENALKTLREQNKGRLFSLIGCEGYRDMEKRPMIGEIAQKLSSVVVITAVDPRGQLEKINKQIIEGCKKAKGEIGKNLFIIDNREKAIEFAISNAKKGDTVAIFGKGHETSLNLDGKQEIPWSDKDAVMEILDGQ